MANINNNNQRDENKNETSEDRNRPSTSRDNNNSAEQPLAEQRQRLLGPIDEVDADEEESEYEDDDSCYSLSDSEPESAYSNYTCSTCSGPSEGYVSDTGCEECRRERNLQDLD